MQKIMLVLLTAYLENNGYAISHEGLGRHVTGIQEPDWNKFYTMGKLLFIHKGA